MHAFTSVMDTSSNLLQSVRAAAAASMAEITVLRTAAHAARRSNVITDWTSVVLHEFYKCLVHKSQVTLSHVSASFLGAVLHFGPLLLAIGNNRIGHTTFH